MPGSIRTGRIETSPALIALLALDQALLPLRVGLPHVMPEACEKGNIPATKGISQIARDLGHVAQVINKKLPLALTVCRMRVEVLMQSGG